MTNSCKEFSESSEYIHNWFSVKQNVKEESFTDWYLYSLSQKLSIFSYREFNRHEENTISGADFDFWILGTTNTISLRVQAKKLKRSGNHYDAITYPSQTKSQINLLLSSTKSPFRPVYLFYNNDINNSKCSRRNSGTLLASAKEINSKFLSGSKMSISRQDIMDISIPLECLFCCPLGEGRRDRLNGIKNILNEYLPTEDSENSGFNGTIPEYVSNIINTQLTNEEWQEKYQDQNNTNVRYVAVLDLREEKDN